MDKETLIRAVREAGVVGEGGAGFPAHVKYDTQVETVIANGCECEPLLYSDQTIMLQYAAEVVRGLAAVRDAVGATRGVMAIKAKYVEQAEAFAAAMQGTGLELARLDNFYPAGDEHILVHEVTGRTIPPLGLPKEVGALVANVGSLYSVARALDGAPVTHKLVTVTGEVARPCVLRVPVGTAVSECLAAAGGPVTADPVLIMGGPMMGRFLDSAEAQAKAVITKTSGGIIVLPRGHHLHAMATMPVEVMQRRASVACIQCRSCTDLCPRHLVGHGFETHKVMRAFGGGKDAAMGATAAALCSECGVCELFSCPMGLSPRRINAALKAAFRQSKVAYEGPREVIPAQTALRPLRKIPTPRLVERVGLGRYMDIHPEFLGDLTPDTVRIPLLQHIGAPAAARVQPGDRVNPGDRIGDIPEGALGAAVHASIGGVVQAVDATITIKGA
ncbi:4Fe-4S dicluster domain-containing protein [Desulfocurvus sp. DL9XJH121]